MLGVVLFMVALKLLWYQIKRMRETDVGFYYLFAPSAHNHLNREDSPLTEGHMPGDKFWMRIIYIVSIVITMAVAFLILGPRPDGMEGILDVSVLPHVNALLNSICTILLLVALWFIKEKRLRGIRCLCSQLLVFPHFSLFLM